MTSIALPTVPVAPLERHALAFHESAHKMSASSMTQSSSSSLDTTESSAPSSSILKIKTQEESLATELPEVLFFRRKPRRKRVRYSVLEIQEYPFCLGDHPGVHGGLPLALDYSQPATQARMGVDEYERQRKPRQNGGEQLRLSRTSRQQKLLTSTSLTAPQIRRCLKGVQKIQQQRGWTSRTMALEPIQEGWEHALAAVSNATWNRRRKSKERELLRVFREEGSSAALAA